MVELLLDNGADIKSVDQDGNTAMDIAIFGNKNIERAKQSGLSKEELYKMLIQGGVATSNEEIDAGIVCNFKAVIRLIKSMESGKKDEKTLLEATQKGQLAFKPYCLNCGAIFQNVDTLSCHSVGDELHFDDESMGGLNCPECNESYDYEIRNETLTLRRCLVPIRDSVVAEQHFSSLKKELDQAVLNLSWQGDVDSIKRYLDDGADVNVTDERDGRTALMKAADGGFDELVKLLLDRGADINAVNYSGRTVLMRACPKCSASTIELILDIGVNINTECKKNTTALM